MKKYRYILTAAVIFGICLSAFSASAEPFEVVSVTTNPSEPVKGSSITVTADFNWDNITEVKITILYCDEISCFNNTKYQMAENNGKWIVQTTALNNKATHMQFMFDVTTTDGDSFLTAQNWRTNFTENDGGNGSNNNNNNSPGFELIVLFAVIAIGILLYKRKRL